LADFGDTVIRTRWRRPALALLVAVPVLTVALVTVVVWRQLPTGPSQLAIPIAAARASTPPATAPALGSLPTTTPAPVPTTAPGPTQGVPGSTTGSAPIPVPSNGHPAPVPASVPPPPPPPPTTTTASATTFTSAGGTIVATCVGSNAELLSWAPAPGFGVKQVDPGPGSEAMARFRSANADWRMTVTCPAGSPVVDVTSEGHGNDGG
jgi:serine/threonine-protein kinase